MNFVAVVEQVITLLRQRGRVTYRTLQRQFQLDEDALADLLAELRYAYRDEILEEEQGVLWVGETRSTLTATAAPAAPTAQAPRTYTPAYGGADPHLPQRPGRRTQAGDRAVCRPQRLPGTAGRARSRGGPKLAWRR